MTSAASIDWSRIERFSPNEWPTDVLQYMTGRIIYTLSDVRNALPRSHSMHPSPIHNAHVRHRNRNPGALNGDRHSTQNGRRLSDATDFFMNWDTVWDAWLELLREPRIGGLGIYLDNFYNSNGKTRPMIHIDGREQRVVWACHKDSSGRHQYTYLHAEPLKFHEIIAERGYERDVI